MSSPATTLSSAAAPAAARVRTAASWKTWFAPRLPRSVTTVMVGERCLVARVDVGDAGRLRLAGVADVAPTELARHKALFRGSRGVLVLGANERHLLTMDRPEVPDAELHQAVRWPLGEALEVEPDALLCTVQVMPRINEAVKPQVLAVAGQLAPARAHMALLAQAGVKLRSIDVCDSALRGMALLQQDAGGTVVLAIMGEGISIGLLWEGRFCALRNLALPVRRPRDDLEFEEHLALHIQRTADHFERQATQLAVARLLAAMPALPERARQSVCQALPLRAQVFELAQAFEVSADVLAQCQSHNELTALACVAAARLIDSGLAPGAARAAPESPEALQ